MIMSLASKTYTAFAGERLLASGPLIEVAFAVRAAGETPEQILVFADATGRVVDLDLRGSEAEIANRLSASSSELAQGSLAEEALPRGGKSPADAPTEPSSAEARGRGRPKLGVVAREVTLLPRHWEWLTGETGGASVALRKLVEEARKSGGEKQRKRAAQEASYRFMSAMAGNRPGFEEAARALFADDRVRFDQQMASWPQDLRAYTWRLAFEGRDTVEDPPSTRIASAPTTSRTAHIEPSPDAVAAFMRSWPKGELVMLNLLRFRDVADYSTHPELAPDRPISGAEAYNRYVAHALPFLRESGGEVLSAFKSGPFLIGPSDERWDRVLLIRQRGLEAFFAFAGNAAYLAGLGHRTAALADSRLLPLTELPPPA
jgi:hypothetical protein